MAKTGKALEDVYQKKTQLEHVLLRPDTYIGSIEKQTYCTWVHDGTQMVQKQITIVPGLYKIFDEILVNAADNKVRDPSMNELRVEVRPETNLIKVWNNGDGVPIEIHKKEKIYIPEMIFGNLLTSSNFDDNEKKMTGGRNGFGAKLANIFSTEFTIETGDGLKEYKQIFTNNMSEKQEPEIKNTRIKSGWTCVTFHPDLVKFGMTHLDDDIVAVIRKRTYDMAGLLGRSVKVLFNGEKIPVRTFEDYVDLYLGKKSDGPPRVHLKANDRWELIVAATDGEFRQMSFVNSICTIKGGTHVNHVVEQLCKALVEKLNKKKKNTLRNFHVKNHLHIFLNCMIENPAFDSQTKENMTTRVSDFGSKCSLPDEFVDKVAKCGVLEQLMNLADLKSQQLLKKTDGSKTGRIAIQKLDDANWAGTRRSSQCTLILTEGDSAKALAVAGITVLGREMYGVFPLRGKLLNVRDASNTTISNNKEIQNLKQIIGLQHNTMYESTDRLRYGHVMIMTDQDYDGSHIKGLIINFLHHCHPSLLRIPEFVQVFVTPIVRVTKGQVSRNFYTVPEYEKWKEEVGDAAGSWKVKYYKGLGTSTREDAVNYFSQLDFHKKEFVYEGQQADDIIDMAFSKKRVAERKTWLSEYTEGTYLDHASKDLSYSDFVNKELILFSRADTDRSIPSIMDGLKPTQRKILFSMFKRAKNDEMKVIELVGFVSQHAAYHHGDASLSATIIGLAQHFVGSNNINLLLPSGQFGTRLQGGKDASAPRYLHTALGPLTRQLFSNLDDDLLKYLDDDGRQVQPEWYVPTIPLVLVNGAEGIGTGWSTSIPNYNPVEIIDNLLSMTEGNSPRSMQPWYMGYTGSITPTDSKSYTVTGHYVIDEEQGMIEIFDLGLKKWTDDYKEFLKEAMSTANGQRQLITDYEDGATDIRINFKIFVNQEQMAYLKEKGVAEALKLTSKLSTSNMVLFSPDGSIHRYEDVQSILAAFFDVRLDFYHKRKANILKKAQEDMQILDNKARFIMAVVEGRLSISNRKKADIVSDLEDMGFDKKHQKKKRSADDDEEDEENNGANYNYLLSMQINQLTFEKVEQIKRQLEEMKVYITEIEATEPITMWREDLTNLKQKYEAFYDSWMEGFNHGSIQGAVRGRARGGGRGGRGRGRRGNGGRTGTQTAAANGAQREANSSRGGRGGRRRGGRGGGRQTAQSERSGGHSGNGSLIDDFNEFRLASGSSANPPPQQSTTMPLDQVAEGDEATSSRRPRPKRKERTIVLTESSSEDESDVPVMRREPRPKRARPQPKAKQTVVDDVAEEDVSEEEASVEDLSDSDFSETANSDDSGSL